jgi:hypothetical protein
MEMGVGEEPKVKTEGTKPQPENVKIMAEKKTEPGEAETHLERHLKLEENSVAKQEAE